MTRIQRTPSRMNLVAALARVRWVRSLCGRVLEARGRQLMHGQDEIAIEHHAGRSLVSIAASWRRIERNLARLAP